MEGAARISGILLGAGRGERLRPLTDVLPKPVLPVLDLPLGLWGLAALQEAGLTPLVNASHLPTALAGALEPFRPFEIFREPAEPFGSAGTLRELGSRLADPVVVWNGDLLADIDLARLIARHQALGTPATVAVTEVGSGADLIVEEGIATSFVDRRRDPAAGGARFLGAGVYSREALGLIPPEGPRGLGETVIASLARDGALGCYVHPGYAADVGTPRRYLDATLDVLAGRAPAPPVPAPGSFVDLDGGRAYLGPGAHSAGTLGPGAVLLAGAEVGPGASVTEAIVWPGTTVPSGTTLERAIWFRGGAIPADA